MVPPPAEFRPGWSRWIVPLPKGCVVVLDPSERRVIVPEPNFCVCPVTERPWRSRSVVIVPEPKGRLSVVVPSDQRVIVPEPNFCVWPVTVEPSRCRSVVIAPEPKGRVSLVVPSDRRVIVPEPNFDVVPDRGCVAPDRCWATGGSAEAVGSTAGMPEATRATTAAMSRGATAASPGSI